MTGGPGDRRVDALGSRADAPAESHYALVDDAHVAYQMLGEGPPLVLVADWFGHLDAMWEWPPYAHSLRALAAFSRLIVFDKRGVGLSDPLPNLALPGLDEWMEDVTAVLDAAALESATLVGVGAGGPMCLRYAASYPSRVDRLVLVNSYARLLRDDDYAPGYPPRLRDRVLASAYTDVEPATVLRGADDPVFVRWWRRFQRQSVSPSTASAMRAMMFETDVRDALPNVRAPTLVLHRRDDQWIRLDHGEYLAEHIPDATLKLLPGGEDLFFHGDADGLIDEIESFVTGGSGEAVRDRILATILFTDLVGSTDLLSNVGDQRWRVILDDHDAIVRRHIDAAGGRLVKSTGDGVLGLFGAPSAAIRCASALRSEFGSIGLQARIGIHAGEVDLRGDDIGGLAVNIGARIMAIGAGNDILVSRTVRDLVVGSGFEFAERGMYSLKGVPEPWQVFEYVR